MRFLERAGQTLINAIDWFLGVLLPPTEAERRLYELFPEDFWKDEDGD